MSERLFEMPSCCTSSHLSGLLTSIGGLLAVDAALAYLRDGKEPLTLNCGYGEGFSVNDVIRAVERAAGKPLPQMICDRRPGDPPVLIAKTDRIHEELDWHPRFNDLQTIAASAFRWEQSLMTNGPTGSAT